MYKLKKLAQRSFAFATAVGFFGVTLGTALPAVTFADALNPLTERTLMLSSSSPGWLYTDGSGNATYAPPGSGPNGQKTSETFSFRVSTGGVALEGFSFQYCTTAAGDCRAPGNGGQTNESNLDINYSAADYGTDFGIYTAAPNGATAADNAGSLVGTDTDAWTLASERKGDTFPDESDANTHNFMTISLDNSGFSPTSGQKIWIKFYADADDYITNPGSGAFFVRLNTFNDSTDIDPLTSTSIVDGGVTVANVMNDSIQLQTKVLETMAFSVGTENPDTVITGEDYANYPAEGGNHGPCDTITENDPINLGDPDTEFALSFEEAFDAHSYWRLSSNSSGGATVYYAGYTLSNTVGDQIDEVGNAQGSEAVSNVGQEQFGLAIDSTADVLDTTDTPTLTNTLLPLTAATNYDEGAGTIIDGGTAKFAFHEDANTIPQVLASDSDDVLQCSTAKMRYLANIAPFTPAGIYTAKVNYIAAPEY